VDLVRGASDGVVEGSDLDADRADLDDLVLAKAWAAGAAVAAGA
jgi:hypothetical protein